MKFFKDNRRQVFLVGCCLFLLFLGISYVFFGKITLPKDSYNIVIICLDTLRADHLSCYGYSRKTSPNIDRLLAANGILFKWAISQSSFTLPSHTSLFTSKYVHNHGVDRIERSLDSEEITLAQILRDEGYKTAAFIYNAIQLAPTFGLNKGFEVYSFGEDGNNRKLSFGITLPEALRWIERHQKDNFFVFLHSNDIHEPYHSSYENFFDSGYKGRLDNERMASGTAFHKNNLTRTPREIQHIIAHYDGGIKYADIFVGKFLEQLKTWGLLKKTIIILLSDHGEILADRGMQFCHGFSLHDEEVHVPLIILHPSMRRRGIRINNQVQLIDIMPTILDFLGIKERKQLKMEGKSLVGLIEGKKGSNLDRYAYAECLKGESEKEGIINRQVMVRTPSWKLISSVWNIKESPRGTLPRTIQLHNYCIISLPAEDGYELYDLKKDPKENKNLINQGYKGIEAELLNKLVSVF